MVRIGTDCACMVARVILGLAVKGSIVDDVVPNYSDSNCRQNFVIAMSKKRVVSKNE